MDSVVTVQISDNGDRAITVRSEGLTYGWAFSAEKNFWQTADGMSTTASSWLDKIADIASEAADYTAHQSPPAKQKKGGKASPVA